MKSESCHLWQRCSAPICPLDANRDKATMLAGEPVCRLLNEAVKLNAAETFRAAGIDDAIFDAVSAAVLPLSERWGRIRQSLDRAKTSGTVLLNRLPKKGGRND